MEQAAAAWARSARRSGSPAAVLGTGSAAVAEVPGLVPAGRGAARSEAGPSALRRRLAAAGGDPVALDCLEDDLREAEAALMALRAWLGGVGKALRDPCPGRNDLLALAGARPVERLERLIEATGGVRRRLAQIASRLA